MKEALHGISLDGVTEIDIPEDAASALDERESGKSPLVYAIPAASFARLLSDACNPPLT